LLFPGLHGAGFRPDTAHDQCVLGLTLWPADPERSLVHDKINRLSGVDTIPLTDSKSHFGAGYQNIKIVPGEIDRPGISRLP
jgi:hypothetical protein